MRFAAAAVVSLILSTWGAAPVAAQSLAPPMQMAIAQAATEDPGVAQFYRDRGFAPIWMGEGAENRRAAFLWALDTAPDHGLPMDRYDPEEIRAAFASARGAAELGALEVEMTRRFLRYAEDVSSGVLDPRRVSASIKLEVQRPDHLQSLVAFTEGNPYEFVRSLWPATQNYTRLLHQKLRLEAVRAQGGWGAPVSAARLEPGQSGPAVVALRERLGAMGYLRPSAVATYDGAMEAAIRAFQIDHGLSPDGVAGEATLSAINVPLEDRLGQILVNLERQRWMNKTLEPRHILVNIAEQHAYVVDDGKVTFDTVVVVGADTEDRRTPEFSHTMTHMVINPSWFVPRSIATKEYLPQLRRGGAQHLQVFSRSGRVNRNSVDFSRYTAQNFPYSLRQAPGPNNALGRVKFMFPNRWNIYLHDTPQKALFGRDVRTFSHGCVRVGRPFELAYHLLTPQEADPRGFFHGILDTGAERRVNLVDPIGVHLVYWSAWVTPTGQVNYRGDPYGRDRDVLRALRDAGVEVAARRS